MRTDGQTDMRRLKVVFLSLANAKRAVQEPGCDDGERCSSLRFMYAGFYFVISERLTMDKGRSAQAVRDVNMYK
jgi:hypothetical protein